MSRKMIFSDFLLTAMFMKISIMPRTTVVMIGWYGCGKEVEKIA